MPRKKTFFYVSVHIKVPLFLRSQSLKPFWKLLRKPSSKLFSGNVQTKNFFVVVASGLWSKHFLWSKIYYERRCKKLPVVWNKQMCLDFFLQKLPFPYPSWYSTKLSNQKMWGWLFKSV